MGQKTSYPIVSIKTLENRLILWESVPYFV